jgi:hypothetical protein
MKEHHSSHKKQAEPGDVEQRLSAYYGPPLPEQLLPPAAWYAVHQRLGVQASARCRRKPRLRLPRKRSRAFVPTAMQEAFARIASEAGIPATQVVLSYRLMSRVHEPAVRGSWLGRRTVQLTLPLSAAMNMERDELDVLLATGLARSTCVRQPISTVVRFLLAGIGLLAGIALIVFWVHHLPLVGAPVALALWAVAAWSWQRQARSLAFHADTLMVRWLGRGPVCSGLHVLAESSRAPRRRRWGEPALDERIERVCGAGVKARENRLTLVG